MTDRFQLVDQPASVPGEDLITRSTVGPFVDCGVWLQPSPNRRRVYLTVDTIRALAEAAGIVQPAITQADITRYRAEGALDYMKENLDGDLARALSRLAAFLDDAELPAGEGEPEDAGDAGGEGD